ncbi:hypothetical protein BDV27DRAFT_132671 [Aspergillus caelatus]|uniref:N-acetyltransferase domain-containing protein n=1 Tax=Aspergillus caelatus TaxID=61420 RepID=A0A5N6ZVM8_9EURO|nr:uncharacterized protein BDV27DRAFT_132671 [Aspergillus caelatus]KAE8361664.1 hypothetical protein BDV27DRAFT_132671 [Aspergillus caelatus]
MDPKYTYSYFRVSKTEAVLDSARKYRDLRLRALQESPGSFASTYEIESKFTNADWADRVTVPDREIFICAATPIQPDRTQLDVMEWIGQVTLRGPMSRDEFTLPVESGQRPPKRDEEEERWQMLSLFTLSEHRGNGLGRNLCREALQYLRNYRSDPPNIHVRLMVKPENHVTVSLYKRLGFIEAGKATLAEALIANGDGHCLPKDTSTAKYSDRTGLIMVFDISRP